MRWIVFFYGTKCTYFSWLAQCGRTTQCMQSKEHKITQNNTVRYDASTAVLSLVFALSASKAKSSQHKLLIHLTLTAWCTRWLWFLGTCNNNFYDQSKHESTKLLCMWNLWFCRWEHRVIAHLPREQLSLKSPQKSPARHMNKFVLTSKAQHTQTTNKSGVCTVIHVAIKLYCINKYNNAPVWSDPALLERQFHLDLSDRRLKVRQFPGNRRYNTTSNVPLHPISASYQTDILRSWRM